MPEVVTAAVLHQQMPANQIRQTRAVFEAIMPGHRAAWSKLGTCEEIAELLKRSTILQRETHQAGHHVVEADQFGGTIRNFPAEEDFGGDCVVMDGKAERAAFCDPNLLRDVIAASGKGATIIWRLSYIGHALCNSL